MEPLAATLTGIVLGFFLVHLSTRGRVDARREAGPLLACVGGFRCVAMGFASVLLGIWTVVHDAALHRGAFMCFAGAVMWTFAACWFLANTSIVRFMGRSWIELRERGVLSGASGRDTVLTPWHRIPYCQWLDSAGTLSIYSLEPFKVAASKRQTVTQVLSTRTEVRDPSGRVLNPEFVRADPAPGDGARADRKPFQYELKTLLLLMTVVGSALAWLATHVRAK